VSYIRNCNSIIYNPIGPGMDNLKNPYDFFKNHLKKRLFMYAHVDRTDIRVGNGFLNRTPSQQNPVRLPSDRHYSHYIEGKINRDDPIYSGHLKGN
jgi:hypothetical protein